MITQTELYAHFMANKNRIKSDERNSDEKKVEILSRLDEDGENKEGIQVNQGVIQSFLTDDYGEFQLFYFFSVDI